MAVITTPNNIAVQAGPGSGKTTSIIEASRLIPYGKSAVFIAFNKSIVETLKSKLPPTVDCSTMHSLGLKAIYKHYPGEKKIKGEGKQLEYIIPLVEHKNNRERWLAIYTIDRLLSLARATMAEMSREGMIKVIENYALDVSEEQVEIAIRALTNLYRFNDDQDRYNITVDFQDMIEMPVRNKKIGMPQYDYVFIDEIQDLSTLDHLFVKRLRKPIGGRIISVGDPHQCQPAGTKILMANGKEKNIEEIVVGDKVVSYQSSRSWDMRFIGLSNSLSIHPKVDRVSSRQYRDYLIVIELKLYKSKYTPNHRCLFRFKDKQGYVTYLMKKGDKVRVGITPLWNSAEFGPGTRLRQERADFLWIIRVSETRQLAYLYEQYINVTYGIPQMIFHLSQFRSTLNQEDINAFYKQFTNLSDKLISCLEDHSLSIDLPFYTNQKNDNRSGEPFRRIGKRGMWECYACNSIIRCT